MLLYHWALCVCVLTYDFLKYFPRISTIGTFLDGASIQVQLQYADTNTF